MRLAVVKNPQEGKRQMEEYFPGIEAEAVFPSIGKALEALEKSRKEREGKKEKAKEQVEEEKKAIEEKKEAEEGEKEEAGEEEKKATEEGEKEEAGEEEKKATEEGEKEEAEEEEEEEEKKATEEEKKATEEEKKEVEEGEKKEVAEEEEENRDYLYILPGRYEENLSVTLGNLSIEGAGRELVTIFGKLGGYEILEDGIKRGTFRTQTVFVHGKDISIRNLTIENGAGQGTKVGQAIALYADGDRLLFEKLNLLGHQDTLFCGPLPEKEIEPGGFRGPLEHAPRINGRQLYRDCRIEGTVDFIFGSATAFFEECQIISVDPLLPGKECLGFVTAPSTPKGQAYGFVFSSCEFLGECPARTIYLGRPWREYARSVFVDCFMDVHIKEEGFHDWGKELSHTESYFAEIGSYGPGAKGERAFFAKQVSLEEKERFAKAAVLGDWAEKTGKR